MHHTTFSTSNEHSLFIDKSGCVWAFGSNSYGQLGLGDTRMRTEPCVINHIPQIVSVHAGLQATFLIDVDGMLWVCGRNHYGQLGTDDNHNRFSPVAIPDLPKIQAVSYSNQSCHTVLLDIDGNVWTSGCNARGELGTGDTINRKKFSTINLLPKIHLIQTDEHYTIFVDCDGNIWATGYNNKGQLGVGDTKNRFKPQKIKKIPPVEIHQSLQKIEEKAAVNKIVEQAVEVSAGGKGRKSPLALTNFGNEAAFDSFHEILDEAQKLGVCDLVIDLIEHIY